MKIVHEHHDIVFCKSNIKLENISTGFNTSRKSLEGIFGSKPGGTTAVYIPGETTDAKAGAA